MVQLRGVAEPGRDEHATVHPAEQSGGACVLVATQFRKDIRSHGGDAVHDNTGWHAGMAWSARMFNLDLRAAAEEQQGGG